MKISTKGQYAILAMYELSLNYNQTSMSIHNIALNQDIPKQYLEQIMKKLRHNNLVDSIRGAKGGYKLHAKPSDITIGQIIRAVEEHTQPVECFGGITCGSNCNCKTKFLWKKITDSISDVIDNETLQDMLEYNK